MAVDLSRSVAVITGGGGIGRAAARSLARRGTQLVVTDIGAGRARAVYGDPTPPRGPSFPGQ